MATPLLSSAKTTISTQIDGMTTAGGYNYNWPTPNEPDLALVSGTWYAHAKRMRFTEETNLDDGPNANSYQNIVTMEIDVVVKMSSVAGNPLDDIEDEYLKALDDLKKLFGTNANAGGYVDYIQYRRWEWDAELAGDTFNPATMRTFWELGYTQDRLTPTTVGCGAA